MHPRESGRQATLAVATGRPPEPAPTPSAPLSQDVTVLQRQVTKLRFLHRLAQDFADIKDVQLLMDTIFDRVIGAVSAQAGSLWLLDRNSHQLVCRVARGPTADRVLGIKLEFGTGVVGWVVQHGEADVVLDASQDHRHAKSVDQSSRFQTHSMITVPLKLGELVMGAIQVINKVVDVEGDGREPPSDGTVIRFDDDDVEILKILGGQAAMAVQNAQRLQRLKLTQELSELFNSTLDFDKLIDTIFAKVVEVTGAEAGSIWLVNRQTGDIFCRNAEGPTKDQVVGLTLKPGTGVVGWVIQNKQAATVYDAEKDQRFQSAVDQKTHFKTRSMLTVPLMVKGEMLGAIQVINKKDPRARFDAEDLDLLTSLCQAAAISVQNAWLFQSRKKVKELSAILDVSKEITATLDLDRVLLTIVNLSSQVVAYEQAAIALDDGRGRIEVAALSGAEKVDAGDVFTQALRRYLAFVADGGREVYIVDTQAAQAGPPAAELADLLVQRPAWRSIWARPLSDEEGRLGVMFMAAAQAGLIQPGQAETLTILANQATVAIRNAKLYTAMPMVGLLGRLKAGPGALGAASWRKKSVLALAAGFIAASFFIPKTRYVSGDCEVVTEGRTAVHAQIAGVLAQVLVDEGDAVSAGQIVAKLDDRDLKRKLADLETRAEILRRDMVQLSSLQKRAELQVKRLELEQALLEQRQVREDLERLAITAPAAGVVITPDLALLPGKLLQRGEALLEVSELSAVRLQIEVFEEDVGALREGQQVVFKLGALPERRFEGAQVLAVRLLGVQAEGRVSYQVVTRVENPLGLGGERLLRPGMTGRASICTQEETLARWSLRSPLRLLRMKFWW